ncbi:MAG: DapH/DapD/GlmU-related protein, partial [Pseudomonadota bacterium]
SMAVDEGHVVGAMRATEESEVMGINDRVQLAEAETEYRQRVVLELMRGGVSLADPARVDVRGALQCEEDVGIDVNCVFEGEVTLGKGVTIGPNCVLRNCRIGAGTTIHAMSHIDDAVVGGECNVGPYARLRPGTALADGARIGNFVETKKAQIGAGSKVNHLSYIGDAELGSGGNGGAGTHTCNYDGINKHRTEMGDGVFIGSNSTLVAPVTIESGGFVGAGSTVTRDVPSEALAVSRAKQRNVEGWQTPKQRADESPKED